MAQDFMSIHKGVLIDSEYVNRYHQNKDTLQEINITASKAESSSDVRKQFTEGQQTLHFDSAILDFYRERSMDALIAEQSPVFVKTYGVNSMATLSIRGASAAQSEVLWNGVPITGAATGISDISLLQAGLFNDISIQYGGSSSLFGSGNVGGALLLEDKIPDFKPSGSGSLSFGAGSFGKKSSLLQAEWEDHHWHFGLKAFWEQAKNNFPYQNSQLEWTEMPNAFASGGGALFNADYLFPKRAAGKVLKQTLSLKAWYQQNDREIPPALFESFSVKQQRDQAFHSLIYWQQQRKRSYYYGKVSFSTDYLHYQDGVVLPDNENQTNQWYAEAGWKWWINNPVAAKKWLHEMLVFMPVEWAFVTGENLEGIKKEIRPAVVVAYKLQSVDERFNLNFSLRREWWNNEDVSWLPGWNGSYRLVGATSERNELSVSLLANVQKSYRVPNINELYFSPGGNPNLMPEQGWSEDGGFSIKLNLGRQESIHGQYTWQLHNQSSFFNRNIRDWIYWLGGAIWTPHNLAAVHSRGIETETKISWNGHNNSQVSIGLKTAYVLATTTASYLPNDNSIGSQIPYSPRYNGIGNIGFSWKGIFVNYNHQYTGYRFVTTDESQFLKPYQTGNLQLSYSFPMGNYSLSFIGQIRNIWDKRYEVVNGRPMPGRNFLLSLKLGWRN